MVRTIVGQLHVGDRNGKVTVLGPVHVDETRVSSVSVMPDGLLKPFTLKETRDLLTYLLSSGPAIPREDAGTPRPAPRSVAEVNAILSGAPFLGHYSWMFDDPLFRVLLFRGIAWTAKEPVDRFNNLVWPDADISRSQPFLISTGEIGSLRRAPRAS